MTNFVWRSPIKNHYRKTPIDVDVANDYTRTQLENLVYKGFEIPSTQLLAIGSWTVRTV
jgi:hypothetical protein